MLRKLTSTCAILATTLSMSAMSQAQEIEPGLWNMKQDIDIPGLNAQMEQMRKQLKNMPPEAKKMLGEQLGIFLNEGLVLQICVTPEEAKMDYLMDGHKENDCTYSKTSRSGNVFKGSVVCKGEGFNGTGDFTTTVHNAKHYSTDMRLMSKEQGPMNMKVDAKFVAPDCGKLAK